MPWTTQITSTNHQSVSNEPFGASPPNRQTSSRNVDQSSPSVFAASPPQAAGSSANSSARVSVVDPSTAHHAAMASSPTHPAHRGSLRVSISTHDLENNDHHDEGDDDGASSNSSVISDYYYDDDGKVVNTHHRARDDAERLCHSYMQMAHSFARTSSMPQLASSDRLAHSQSFNSSRPALHRNDSSSHNLTSLGQAPLSHFQYPPSNPGTPQTQIVPAISSGASSSTNLAEQDGDEQEMTINSNGDGVSNTTASPNRGMPPRALSQSIFGETDNESFSGLREYVDGQPRHVRRLVKAIKELSKAELIHISGMASLKAYREVFSIRQYSGEAWYLPKTRKVKEGEARWGINSTLAEGLKITFAGREVSVHVISIIIRLVMLVLLWLAAWNALHPYHYLLQPGGYIFDPVVTVIASALIGGVICRILGIPPLVGVLWAAIMWRNIPLNPEAGSGDPEHMTDGIIAIERTIASRGGLTLILVRAGFSINVAALRPILPNALTLGTLAMGVEGVVTSFVAEAIFGYGDWSWAFLQGFVCSVVSAAIVVPGTLVLQAEGYSKARGPLPQMLSSVGLETVLGVWCINFMIGLMFDTTPIGLAIALGPIQIIVGVIIGILTGIIFHFTIALVRKEAIKLPTGKYTVDFTKGVSHLTLILFLSIAFTYVYAGNRLKLAGGGSVAAMVFSATVSHIWTGKSPFYDEQKKALGTGLADVWDLFVMPILFASTGSSVKLTQVFNSYFFPRGLACWAAGTATRVVVATMTGLNTGLDWKEHLFLGVSWVGKAGIQSSMGSAALTRANAVLATTAVGTAEYAAAQLNVERATLVQSNAILYILICAPLGAIWVTKLGPILLKKDPPRH